VAKGPLSTYRPLLDSAVFVLGLLGILVVVHLWIQSDRGFDRGCFGFDEPEYVDPSFDCEAVTRSEAGSLFGVSNVIWGGLFYLGLTGLSLALTRVGSGRVQNLKKLRAAAITFGFAYSVYLSYVQYSDIGEYCKLCLMSASIVMLMFILQVVDFVTKADSTSSKSDVSSGRRWFLSLGLMAATVVLAGADVAYFRTLPPPQEESRRLAEGNPGDDESPDDGLQTGECAYDLEKPFVENYRDLVNFNDPSLGNPEAPVVVIEFFDPNCPHCKTTHPIMKQVIEANSEKAWFVIRPFVLWQQSLAQTEALMAAAHEGKYFEMLEAQFSLQKREGLSLEELKSIASQIGMDADLMASRIQQGLFRGIVLRQRESGIEAGVTSVPAVMINGRFVNRQSRTADCLTELIGEAS